jgi:CHAD domain-containing protein
VALDFNEVGKPFNKLRKLLKKFPKQPSAKQVHDIRTRTRGVEAALAAVSLDGREQGQRLLGAITPVRKRAGKVRDMDVLTGFASTLTTQEDNECIVQLLEHLGQKRFNRARKLYKTVRRNRNQAVRSLKRCSSSIEKRLDGKKKRSSWEVDAAATALHLSGELTAWPKLTANNLHSFRLKVKELRNVIKLSKKNVELVKELGQVQDAIGEWHDWTELASFAAEILDHSQGCEIQQQIRAEAKKRFEKALQLANRLREQYFEKPGPKSKRARLQRLKQPVLEATATLAA